MKDAPFIRGTVVSLRMPNIDADILNGSWHEWFNDQEITEFLGHGVFPVNPDRQAEFIASEMSKSSSLILAIDSNETGAHIGVVSLKSINHIQRTAEIAIVMGFDKVHGAALEAMALMTKHAFNRLNLLKLYAGQHESLWKWVNTLGVIGYKVEGYRECWGYRNGKPWGAIMTGVSADHFYELQAARGGDILQGDVKKISLTRSKVNFIQSLRQSLMNINSR